MQNAVTVSTEECGDAQRAGQLDVMYESCSVLRKLYHDSINMRADSYACAFVPPTVTHSILFYAKH